MIKPEVMQRMGRLEPKEERYYIQVICIWLEAQNILLVNSMDQIIPEDELPIGTLVFQQLSEERLVHTARI